MEDQSFALYALFPSVLSFIAIFFNRIKSLLPLQRIFHGNLCSTSCNLLWRIEELDLELLAYGSREGINPSSLDMILKHISAIYLTYLALDLYFPADQGSNARRVIFQSCKSRKSFLCYLGNPSHLQILNLGII